MARRVTIWRVVVAVLLLGSWEGAVVMGAVDPFFVSRPSAIGERVWIWISSGYLWRHLFVTLEEALLGLVIGGMIGVTTGFALARSLFAARVAEPFIAMLNAVPRVG